MSTLDASYDDPHDPAELTVYAPDDDCRQTCWLTIDVDHVIDLAGMA